MASSSSAKKVILISNNGQKFEVDETVALFSQTVKHLIEVGCIDGGITLHNVDSATLAKVLEYCTHHASNKRFFTKFESKYVEDLIVDRNMLYAAANYLNIKGLLNLTCQAVSDMIIGKTVEKIRETFNIKNDFTEEEEAVMRAENSWAFE
ncbi:SKP1-like protein 11 [Salvia divinorum]|uniref:SKP1-like protein n=1 Tax=Salvia divinorum TaxID=28513 RepID=A0ABD1GR61_SALDI